VKARRTLNHFEALRPSIKSLVAINRVAETSRRRRNEDFLLDSVECSACAVDYLDEVLRLYSPPEPFFAKTWRSSEIELVK